MPPFLDIQILQRESNTHSDGAVAQMGERCNRTAEVRGSIPLGSTSPMFILRRKVVRCRLPLSRFCVKRCEAIEARLSGVRYAARLAFELGTGFEQELRMIGGARDSTPILELQNTRVDFSVNRAAYGNLLSDDDAHARSAHVDQERSAVNDTFKWGPQPYWAIEIDPPVDPNTWPNDERVVVQGR